MFLLCVAGLPLSTIHAQKKEIIDDEAPNGIVIVTIDKAGDEIIRIMNESQLPYIHDPKAPRFLLMANKANSPWVSEGMSVPPASMILEVLWMILTLFLPTFQAVVKSKINFKWMPVRPLSF